MRHSELTPIHGCDVKVSKLSLGTAPLGGLFKKVAESESDAVIREALDAGIAYIDNADTDPLEWHEGFVGKRMDLVTHFNKEWNAKNVKWLPFPKSKRKR